MKKLFAIFVLMLLSLSVSAQNYHFDVNGDKNVTVADVMLVVHKILGHQFPEGSAFFCPDNKHPHMIDLGLPSGTKWSCCNIGATSPIEYGGYYAWGETDEKDWYNWGTYIYCNGSGESVDDLGTNISNTKYDVAYWKTTGKYCMPTMEQLKELYENCTYEVTTVSGVKGMLFTGSNESSIFLPLGGFYSSNSVEYLNNLGRYWSDTKYDNDIKWSKYLVFGEEMDPFISWEYRSYGQNIRPVENTSSGPGTTAGFGLAMSEVSLLKGSKMTVPVTNGSGNYTVSSSASSVATAEVDGTSVTITAISEGEATITVTDTNSGQTAAVEVTVTESVMPSYTNCPDNNHPHLIDLGLPSGTKWACCNIDSQPSKQRPANYGGYFAWGETEEKEVYDLSTYRFFDASTNTNAYLGNISGTEYDVAHVRWGEEWVMPTYYQFQELAANCTAEWTTVNGFNGYQYTSSNGASIFLPAAGYKYESELYSLNEELVYMTDSRYTEDDWEYIVDYWCAENGIAGDLVPKEWGSSVRPVYNPSGYSPLAIYNIYHDEDLILLVGEEADNWISSGSGSYSVTSSNTNVATATLNDNFIHVTAVGTGTATVIVTDNRSRQTAAFTMRVTSLCPDDHHPHLIDLGLPSGTKWACCNVDTDHPENQSPGNPGAYYAWGETATKDTYDWSTYTHCNGDEESCHDLGSDIAGTNYDVAHMKWGGNWKMPSSAQIQELFDNCTYDFKTVDGYWGWLFISSNGRSIFLPMAGYYMESDHTIDYFDGRYWSSTQHPSYSYDAYNLRVSVYDNDGLRSNNRCYGLTVRPIAK
jgi:hypothetical protein